MAKIAIIEDDTRLAEIYQKLLGLEGYEVFIVSNINAVETLRSNKPDLLLLDIILPGKSGFDILEEIRVKHNSKTPVIIISNLDQDNDKALAKNLGISDYIVKSDISLRTLMSKINQALSK